MNARLFRLTEVHQRIDHALRREQRQKWRDPFQIARLKKLKLRVKDLIHRHSLKLRSA